MPVTRRCKLLCPECGGPKKVRDIVAPSVALICGHWRSTGLLPLLPGRVSIENIRTSAGNRLFPYDKRDAEWRLD